MTAKEILARRGAWIAAGVAATLSMFNIMALWSHEQDMFRRILPQWLPTLAQLALVVAGFMVLGLVVALLAGLTANFFRRRGL